MSRRPSDGSASEISVSSISSSSKLSGDCSSENGSGASSSLPGGLLSSLSQGLVVDATTELREQDFQNDFLYKEVKAHDRKLVVVGLLVLVIGEALFNFPGLTASECETRYSPGGLQGEVCPANVYKLDAYIEMFSLSQSAVYSAFVTALGFSIVQSSVSKDRVTLGSCYETIFTALVTLYTMNLEDRVKQLVVARCLPSPVCDAWAAENMVPDTYYYTAIVRTLRWSTTTSLFLHKTFQIYWGNSQYKTRGNLTYSVHEYVVPVFGNMLQFALYVFVEAVYPPVDVNTVSWPLTPRLILVCCVAGIFVVVVSYAFMWFMSLARASSSRNDAVRFIASGLALILTWSGFGVSWFLADLRLISRQSEAALYRNFDTLSKIAYTMTFIAITEKERGKRLVKAREQVEQLKEFWYNFTHELRTPLNGVIGFSSLALESGDLTPETYEYVRVTGASAKSMLALINQITNFKTLSASSRNKFESGTEELFAPEDLLNDSVGMACKLVDQSCELFVKIAPITLFSQEVKGDFIRSRMCIIKLLERAIESSAQSGAGRVMLDISAGVPSRALAEALEKRSAALVRPQYKTRVQGARKHKFLWLEVAITDNGHPIPPEEQRDMFTPFSRRLLGNQQGKYKSGLGLAIVQGVVDSLGGDIKIEDNAYGGATFRLLLPFRIPSRACHRPRRYPKDVLSVIFVPDQTLRDSIKCLLRCYGAQTEDLRDLGDLCDAERIDEAKKLIPSICAPRVAIILHASTLADSSDFFFSLPDTFYFLALEASAAKKSQVNPFGGVSRVKVLATPLSPQDVIYGLGSNNAPTILEDLDEETDSNIDPLLTPRVSSVIHGDKMKRISSSNSFLSANRALRVLAVDDSDVNLLLIKRVLQSCNLVPDTAKDGAEGLQLFKEASEIGEPYDLVFLDIMMPLMDGIEASKKMRAVEERNRQAEPGAFTRPATIIAFSAAFSQTKTLVEAGMDGFMPKPFQLSSMREAVQQVTSGTYLGFRAESSEDLS